MEITSFASPDARIAVIGNYVPRQCGIATFTADLCDALAAEFPHREVLALAMNDNEQGYSYPERVRFEIPDNDLSAYRTAADFLNVNQVDAVFLQHEFGIFGGQDGNYILALLRELRMPVITTLHTILRQPTESQRKIMIELAKLSDRLISMSRKGVDFLREIYAIPVDKIDLIPHGIPDIPFVDPNYYKDQFGLEGKQTILTFGLINPNKGIEYVIQALPRVVKRHPNVCYVVLGATHPHVIRHDNEIYRLSLQHLAEVNNVEDCVIFHNRFVSSKELIEFIGAADIYITPYLNQEQITSGTLSYALGAGKAIISTPYWHAQELLADGRGLLVPFRDADAIADKINWLLENETERHAMRKRAYQYGRTMIWKQVARQYWKSYELARLERSRAAHKTFITKTLEKRPKDLPAIKLDHLLLLTDDTGILQHAIYNTPNYNSGYTTDDNARGLVLATLLSNLQGNETPFMNGLAERFLAFLWYAYNPDNQRFRNNLAYDRRWLEDAGSEDSHARAIYALGTVAGRSSSDQLQANAAYLLTQGLPVISSFTSPRAWSYAIVGLDEYLRRFPGDRKARQTLEQLAYRLMNLYQDNHGEDWLWFEDRLTYCNAILPRALIRAGATISSTDMLDVGLNALNWLLRIQRPGTDYFVPIGTNGFYKRGGERARFDQQPVEAQETISACLDAYRITGEPRLYKEAHLAFEWFLGWNDLNLPLYNPSNGGCHDGLHPDRVNQNQGAESTLAFIMSLAELRLIEIEANISQNQIYAGEMNEIKTSNAVPSSSE